MNNIPKISVILTSYNHDKYIKEAIDSVLNQTFANYELIIIDDASTDTSWKIISSYTDPRITKHRNAVNGGGVEGLNFAISSKAKGEYIAIHHSDDIWEPEKLEKQVAYLERNPDCGAVFTNALIIEENGSSLLDENHFYHSVFQRPNRSRYDWLNFFFKNGNALCHPSLLIRKQCYKTCGVYRRGLAQMTDFDMWVRLCLQYEIHIMPEKLVKFRVRDKECNMSGDTLQNRSRQFFEFYMILDHYKTVDNVNDFMLIFPTAKKYIRDSDIDMLFALALISIEESDFLFSKLFGLEILFRLIECKESADRIKSWYNFEHRDFIKLTAQYGISNKSFGQIEAEIHSRDARLSSLEVALNDSKVELRKYEMAISERDSTIRQRDSTIRQRDSTIRQREEVIDALYSSRSWKITRPLRMIGEKILRKKNSC